MNLAVSLLTKHTKYLLQPCILEINPSHSINMFGSKYSCLDDFFLSYSPNISALISPYKCLTTINLQY